MTFPCSLFLLCWSFPFLIAPTGWQTGALPPLMPVRMQGASSSGSGLILEPDGTILTSAQIVSAAAETKRGINGSMQLPQVHITLQDGRIFLGRVTSLDRQGPCVSRICVAAC